MNVKARILEPARELPVLGEFDVVVIGGGIAGVAAAVAAARRSVRVCLVERYCALGGLATLGNIAVWLPLCDGRGHQVIAGLAEELLKLSICDVRTESAAAWFLHPPACWQEGGDLKERSKKRYKASFNPAAFMLALESLVIDAGITLLYDTRFCAVQREARQLTHVIVENKSGRSALAAGVFIDATGDADVCFAAGEATESLDSNVLAGWFYTLADGHLTLHKLTEAYNVHGKMNGAKAPFLRGDDATELTAHLIWSRRLLLTRLADLRAQDPNHDVQPIMPATIANVRMTRRLVAELTVIEARAHHWFADTIGLSGDWHQPGPVYAIPFRALRGVNNTNLLAAGRCISASGYAWDTLRAIAPCVVTGEAAGTAAALAIQHGDGHISSLDIDQLQAQLRQQKVLLDRSLVERR